MSSRATVCHLQHHNHLYHPFLLYRRARHQWQRGRGRGRCFSNQSNGGGGGGGEQFVTGDSHFSSVTDSNLGFRSGRPNFRGGPPFQSYNNYQRPPNHFRPPPPPYGRCQPFRQPQLRPPPPQTCGQSQTLHQPQDFHQQPQFRPQPSHQRDGQPQVSRSRPSSRASDYRIWESAKSTLPPNCERFIVLSYNILADYLAMKHRRRLYFHIPYRILDWEYRKQRIIFEMDLWSADIMCLQEVDRFCELEEELKARGYSGIWKMRSGDPIDGCAIFWRASRFTLRHEEFIEYNKIGLRDNVAQICVLESTSQHDSKGMSAPPTSSAGPSRVVVCNIHVLYNPKRGEIKLGQVRALLDGAYAVSKTWNDAPVVICGDFNCTPKSPLYNFVAEQKLDLSGIDRDKVSGQANAEIDTPMPDKWHPRTRSVDNSNQVPALDDPEVGAVLPPPMSQENHSDRNSGNFPSTNSLSQPQSMHSFENSCDGQQCGDENSAPRETQQDVAPECKEKLESTTCVSTGSSDESRCISGNEVLASVEQANDENYHYEGGTSVAIEMDHEQNVDTASQSVQQSSRSTVTGIISSDNRSLSFKDDDHSTVAKIISASVDVSNFGSSLSEQSQSTSSTDGPLCPESSATLSCQSIGDDMISSSWTSQEASITLESSSISFILDEKMDKLSLNKLNEGKNECDASDEDNVNSTFLSELHDSEDVLSDFGPSHLPCDDILDEISSSMVSEPAEGNGNTYDCSLWTPMEMETATGKADCTIVEHPLKLRSTYTEVEDNSATRDSNGEPLVTSYHRCFLGTVDYIWRSEGLQTVRVLAPIPKQAMQWTVGYPTPKWGSDHIALVSELAITEDGNNSNMEFQ